MNQEINNNIQENSKLNLNNIGVTISIINAIYCAFMLVRVSIALLSGELDPSYASLAGWSIIILPFFIALNILLIIPDLLCLKFSKLYNKKRKKLYLVLIIIFSFIGYTISSTPLSEYFTNISLAFIFVYKVLKIIMIIYSIILLIFNKKHSPNNI